MSEPYTHEAFPCWLYRPGGKVQVRSHGVYDRLRASGWEESPAAFDVDEDPDPFLKALREVGKPSDNREEIPLAVDPEPEPLEPEPAPDPGPVIEDEPTDELKPFKAKTKKTKTKRARKPR